MWSKLSRVKPFSCDIQPILLGIKACFAGIECFPLGLLFHSLFAPPAKTKKNCVHSMDCCF